MSASSVTPFPQVAQEDVDTAQVLPDELELAEELDDETDGNSLSEEIKKLGYDSPIRKTNKKFI